MALPRPSAPVHKHTTEERGNVAGAHGIVATWVLAALSAMLVGCGTEQRPAAESGSPSPSPTASEGLDYVALGDSIITSADVANTDYPSLYADALEVALGQEVELNNEAVPNSTSADLLSSLQLETATSLSAVLAEAEIITLQISYSDTGEADEATLEGGCAADGDLSCHEDALEEMKTNMQGIVEKILSLRSTSDTIIRILNVQDPFPENEVLQDVGFPPDYSETIRPITEEWNGYICDLAEENDIPCVDVYAAFNGPKGSDSPFSDGLISDDGQHLSDEGHELIASELEALGYAPLG
jgi:lysophospholipase L1-like esterase